MSPGRPGQAPSQAKISPESGLRPRSGVANRVAGGLLLLVAYVGLVAVLTLWNLTDLSKALNDLSTGSLPRVTTHSRLAYRMNELGAALSRLAQARTQPDLRLAAQDSEARLTDLDQLVRILPASLVKENFLRSLQGVRESTEELKELALGRIAAQEGLESGLGRLDVLSAETSQKLLESLNFGAPSQGSAALVDWNSRLAALVRGASQAPRSQLLAPLRALERQAREDYVRLQASAPLLPPGLRPEALQWTRDLNDLLFGEQGIFPLSAVRLRETNRASGVENFTRSLLADIARLNDLAYDEEILAAELASQDLSGQLSLQLWSSLGLGLAAMILIGGVYLFFRRHLTSRLVALNKAVLARMAGASHPIRDEGDDEIADIAGSAEFFASEVERREQRFKVLLEASPIGVGMARWDDGALIYANQGCRAILGAELEPLGSLGLDDFFSDPDQRRRVRQVFRDEGRVRNLETRLKRANGQPFWSLLSLEPLETEAGKNVLYWILDIDRLKQIQVQLNEAKDQAEAANQAKSAFLANMSHEIRTPMNAILGMAHLASKTILTQEQKGYLSKIDSAAQTLLSVINDILDFSKIEAGRLEIEDTRFALEDVLSTVSDLTSYRAEAKGLELVFDLDPRVARDYRGDPLRLGQVLINLCANAVKFTERGEVRVRVRPLEDPTDHLEFSVEDTGIGLSAEQQSRLFQSFSQADVSTTRKHGGTGLGLAISQQLVQLMGGRIQIDSTLGQGSRFWFSLPLPVLTPPQEGPAELKGRRCLVVDDNPEALGSLTRRLEAWGAQVDGLHSAGSALRRLGKKGEAGALWDWIFVDYHLPGVNGLAFLQALQEEAVPLTERAFLLIGGQDSLTLPPPASCPCRAFLTKPLLPQQLLRAFGLEAEDARPGSPGEGSSAEAVGPRPHPARVLLVEDHPINRELVKALLMPWGFQVEEAENGLTGLKQFQDQTPDLVLMDIQMPEMDGLTAAREIRKLAEGQTVPIIAMTAHASAEDRRLSLEAGMNDHLVKPLDPKKLLETLQRWLPVSQKDRPTDPPGPGPSDLRAHLFAAAGLPLELPGFDLAEAWERCGRDAPLLKRVLLQFKEQITLAPGLMQQILGASDPQKALIQLHSLKGIAAHLGARNLADRCQSLEAAVKAGSAYEEAHTIWAAEAKAALSALQVLTP